jgi:hypothetical protein
MRTITGPYADGTPEAIQLEKMDKSIVSAVELADIAIKLAALRGLKEPDVAGAIELLKKTWQARNAVTPLRCADLRLAWYPLDQTVEAVSASTHVEKSFPGAELIRSPKAYPVTTDEAVRLISGEYSRKRRMNFRLRMLNCAREAMGLTPVSVEQLPLGKDDDEVEDEIEFWKLAKSIAPFCPRFAKLDKTPQGDRLKLVKPKKKNKGKKSS